jgi:hypothetical protein
MSNTENIEKPAVQAAEVPEWINETPDAPTYRLVMTDWASPMNDDVQEIELTRAEFIALKERLAKLRGYAETEDDSEAEEAAAAEAIIAAKRPKLGPGMIAARRYIASQVRGLAMEFLVKAASEDLYLMREVLGDWEGGGGPLGTPYLADCFWMNVEFDEDEEEETA